MRWRGRGRLLRCLLASALVTLTVFLSSCGRKDRLGVYPVKGKILVDGKPAEGACISLFPKNAPERDEFGKDASGNLPYFPSGRADEKGEFALSTLVSGDGAPAGEYAVNITWPVRYNLVSKLWEGDKLKGRYGDRKKPALHTTIEPQAQELPPFELKSSGPENNSSFSSKGRSSATFAPR